MMTGDREEKLLNAARLLMDARRTNTPFGDLPESLRPVSLDEAYFVQDRLALVYGAVGGWKVGAATPETTPTFAPMPLAWIAPSGCLLPAATHRYRGLEAEIAFLIGQDLPPRQTAYTRDEVVAAIESCHPAIEVLESGLIDRAQASKLSVAADLAIHGGFVYGPAYPNWKSVDFTTEKVTLTVDGIVREERTGSNTSGDLVKLLPWLANEGSSRTGGLKAGQWVTTGSWTGVSLATAGSIVRAEFSTVGTVGLQFE
jgi:2-keto-4-pentenoate hydratase